MNNDIAILDHICELLPTASSYIKHYGKKVRPYIRINSIHANLHIYISNEGVIISSSAKKPEKCFSLFDEDCFDRIVEHIEKAIKSIVRTNKEER